MSIVKCRSMITCCIRIVQCNWARVPFHFNLKMWRSPSPSTSTYLTSISLFQFSPKCSNTCSGLHFGFPLTPYFSLFPVLFFYSLIFFSYDICQFEASIIYSLLLCRVLLLIPTRKASNSNLSITLLHNVEGEVKNVKQFNSSFLPSSTQPFLACHA